MQNFRNLLVWQKAHQLTLDIYDITKGFPDCERFGLLPQLRRAGYSVPSNLAEGAGKITDKDFRRSVSIAFGSLNELKYFLLLSFELKYISKHDYEKLDTQSTEVKWLLFGLITRLGAQIKT